jgi:hypothetical protein
MTGQVVVSSPSASRSSRPSALTAERSAPIVSQQLEPALTGASADASRAGEVLQQLAGAWD